MDLRVMAAASLGCSFGIMFKIIVDAIESHCRMKLMMQGAMEYAQNEEKGKKKTQKK